MKNRTLATTIASILGFSTYALAASGAEYEGSSLLLALFIGFGSLVIALQFAPGMVMLYSMIKGLISPAAKENTSSSPSK